MKIESFCKKWVLLFFLLILFGCNSSGGSGSQDGRDTESPAKPAAISVSDVLPDKVTINWPASSDNVGVARYRIYRNGARIAETAETSYTDASVTSSGRYCYTVSAVDSAGNESVQSAETCADVPAMDTQAPSVPANLSASYASASLAKISWTASSDNIAVTGYKIYRNGSYLASSTTNSFTDTGITATERFCYTVSAFDAAGNESSRSSESCLADTEPPSVPGGVTAYTEPGIIISWAASTDNSGVAGYKIFRDGNYLSSAPSTSFIDTGISATERHYYNVSAYDAAGNESARSTAVFINKNPGKVLWKYETGGEINTDPAIATDGTVYVSSKDGFLYALNQNGTLKWKYNTEGTIGDYNSPSIGADGTIYIGSSAFLHALNPDGSVKWKYQASINSCPAIGLDGTVYANGSDNYFYAINPGGSLKWKYETVNYGTIGSPSIGRDGTIYQCSWILYAFNPDGTLKWSSNSYNVRPYSTNPAIASDNSVYVGAYNYLYAFNNDGSQKWSLYRDPESRSIQTKIVPVNLSGHYYSPVTGSDGSIYVASENPGRGYYLNSVSSEGALKWKNELPLNNDYGSPAIGSDEIIYFHMTDGSIASFNPDGSLKWKTTIGGGRSSAAISDNGTIYVGSTDHNLYAVDSDSMGIADSSCPKIHRDNRNSGNYMSALEDTISPAVPANIQIKPSTIYPSSLDLSWDASVDGSGYATGYKIYRNGQYLGLFGRGFTDKEGLNISERCCYRISAVDLKGNESELSEEICFTSPIATEGSVKWKFKTPAAYIQSVSLGADGTVYCNGYDSDDSVYAINKNGTLKWNHAGTGWYLSISSDGTIYSGRDFMSAFSPDGTLKWTYSNGNNTAFMQPSIGTDGTLYSGDNKSFFALTPQGALKWKLDVESGPGTSSAIASDGTIYTIVYPGLLYAISPSGSVKWSYYPGNVYTGSPVIGASGTVFVSGGDNELHAVNPDGTLKWKHANLKGSRLLVGIDDVIYARSVNGTSLQAINIDGSEKWTFGFSGNFNMTPPVQGKDGIIYIAPGDGSIYAIRPDGTKKWSLDISLYSPTPNSPAIDQDGTLYIGSENGYIYAIQTSSMGLANSSWPSIYRDNQNTCRVP